jgi:hypothetical protein
MAVLGRFGPLFAMMAGPALLATVAASYTAFWFYHGSHLKGLIAEWAEARRAEGHAVAYTVDGTSGFPFSVEVGLKTVRLDVRRGDSEIWSLHAPELTVKSGVFSPREISLDLPKSAQLGLSRPGLEGRLAKTAGTARIDLSLAAKTGTAVRLTLAEAQFAGTWRGTALASPLIVGDARGSLLLASPPNPAEASVRLDLAVRDLRWPSNLTYSLGQDLAMFDLSAKLSGPMAHGGEAFDTLTRWRDAGGKVTIDRLAMKWGTSAFAGYGSFGMDENLQPSGSLVARVEGFVPLVDVLEEADLIRAADATLARLVIGRQMPRSGAGNLSLSLHDGAVMAEALTLVQVPRLDWPQLPKKPVRNRLTPGGEQLLQPGIDIGRDGAFDRQGSPLQ